MDAQVFYVTLLLSIICLGWVQSADDIVDARNIIEKRQDQSMPEVLSDLRMQILQYRRGLTECRRRVELLSGTLQTPQGQQAHGQTSYNWPTGNVWVISGDDRKKRSAKRQTYYPNSPYNSDYWTNYYIQLQHTLQNCVQDFNQCAGRLQNLIDAQKGLANKEQVAGQLLNAISTAAINLNNCVARGGTTYVDQSQLARYLGNGGFVDTLSPSNSQSTGGTHQTTANSPSGVWPVLLIKERRRRYVKPNTNIDWTLVTTQRQQWKSFVEKAVTDCWATLGRRPDGSLLPTSSPTPSPATAKPTVSPSPSTFPPSLPNPPPVLPHPPPAIPSTNKPPTSPPTTKPTPKPTSTSAATPKPTTPKPKPTTPTATQATRRTTPSYTRLTTRPPMTTRWTRRPPPTTRPTPRPSPVTPRRTPAPTTRRPPPTPTPTPRRPPPSPITTRPTPRPTTRTTAATTRPTTRATPRPTTRKPPTTTRRPAPTPRVNITTPPTIFVTTGPGAGGPLGVDYVIVGCS